MKMVATEPLNPPIVHESTRVLHTQVFGPQRDATAHVAGEWPHIGLTGLRR